MNDMKANQMTALPTKVHMFELAKRAGGAMAYKMDMSFIANVTDLENGMPVLIVTPLGMNMGTVEKRTSETDGFLVVLYTLNEIPLYGVTYPIKENGGTGSGVVQNLLPEGAVTYMGW
jgi:hypothetical protein